ncbi:MAG: hypothetical protein R2729_26150 [Bryobacteraceae bacterium]
MERKPNVVRLMPVAAEPKPKKKEAGAAGPKTTKLAIRLLESLNGPVRTQTQYRGDLSQIVMDAVAEVDLKGSPLVDIREPKAGETCVMLNKGCLGALKRAAKERGASLNTIVNTAVAHWLAGKRVVRLER